MEQSISQSQARKRFLRIAPQRMEAVLRRLQLLSQCAGLGYRSEESEEQRIISTLREQVDDLEYKFAEKHRPKEPKLRVAKAKPTFSFDNHPLFNEGEADEHN